MGRADTRGQLTARWMGKRDLMRAIALVKMILLILFSGVGCAAVSEPSPAPSVGGQTPEVNPGLHLSPTPGGMATTVAAPTVAPPTAAPSTMVVPTATLVRNTPSPAPATFTPMIPPATFTPMIGPSAIAPATRYPYGVTYADPHLEWTAADRPAVRENLEYLQALGVNTIVQAFSSDLIGTAREKDWLIFLDEAARADIQVLVRLWPPIEWDGQAFDFQAVGRFLAVVQDHPAFLAYAGLHEPLEQFDSDQLRDFYTGVKRVAPDVKIAHYMGDMAWFEQSWRFPNRAFSAGICDICIVWYYPFRYVEGQPVFETEKVRETLRTNRALMDERAPDAQLWFLGQVYTLHQHKRDLRMPTPEEMEMLYTIVESGGADGFLWYPWLHGNCDQVLSDPDMEPQRQAVYDIYEKFVLE